MSEQASSSKNRLILFSVIALIIGGIVGYLIGANVATSQEEKELNQKIVLLENELEQAKAGASDEVQEGQEAITEGQQSLETLQAENATLKATIEEQNTKIANLEKELEEAQKPETPTN